MFENKYRNRENKNQVQIITTCKILPKGVDGVCYQELSGDFVVNVMEANAFYEVHEKVNSQEIIQAKTPKKISKAEISNIEKKKPAKELPQEEVSDEMRRLLAFLDADSYREKIQLLTEMRGELNDHMLNNMAVSLDLSIEDGMDGYSLIMSELKIRSKFEGKRGERL